MAEKIQKELKNDYFYDDDLKEYIFSIAELHSGPFDITRKIVSEEIFFENKKIDIWFLAALLRFADELDICEDRIDKKYYKTMKDLLDEDQHIHWERSLRIKGIEIIPGDCIWIHASLNKDDLKKLYKKDEIEVTLLDEIIFLVNKINTERKRYMVYVKKYVEFNNINLQLNIDRNKPISFEFNNDQDYFDFWRLNPNLHPGKIIDNYTLQLEEEINNA